MRREREDIQNALNRERKQAKKAQASYDERTNQLTAGIQALQIEAQNQNALFQDAYARQAAQFTAQNEELRRQAERQEAAAREQAAALQGQIAVQQAEATEQRRIATNLGRAAVPDAAQGATGPSQTEGSIDGTRRKKDNELSELSIVSNAQNTSPLAKAGLQIA